MPKAPNLPPHVFFESNGDMAYCRQPYHAQVAVNNYEFTDILRLAELNRSNSSIVFVWRSVNDGRRYYMFERIGKQLLAERVSVPGHGPGFVIEGKFRFIKRGVVYSIDPV